MEVQVVTYIHKTFKSACNIFAAIWYFSITEHGIQEYATGISSTNNTLNCLVWSGAVPYQAWQMDSLATCTNISECFKPLLSFISILRRSSRHHRVAFQDPNKRQLTKYNFLNY